MGKTLHIGQDLHSLNGFYLQRYRAESILANDEPQELKVLLEVALAWLELEIGCK
ncbi:hypothetical protein DSO57_1013031 [Entomophthora muscae]|uniref:Uncharacterized protein n=1 Tax=Entomophthora muscae TaxID=34485 RepID=A0ACC2S7Q4_9FUNG|nr:hypothetical protein DSO57_1013031 [Entomophthora muscae]